MRKRTGSLRYMWNNIIMVYSIFGTMRSFGDLGNVKESSTLFFGEQLEFLERMLKTMTKTLHPPHRWVDEIELSSQWCVLWYTYKPIKRNVCIMLYKLYIVCIMLYKDYTKCIFGYIFYTACIKLYKLYTACIKLYTDYIALYSVYTQLYEIEFISIVVLGILSVCSGMQ